MATHGQTVRAVISEIVESDIHEDQFGGRYEYGNFVRVKVLDETAGWQKEYIFGNSGPFSIPFDQRVVGNEGLLQWASYGSYHGPLWVKQNG